VLEGLFLLMAFLELIPLGAPKKFNNERRNLP